MAVKFSQFTNTTDPTAIEKVVGYTTAGSVNFQIPTANLDTTYLITSPETVSGRIDLTLTGTKAGVSSTDVVEITSAGNITLENTTDGFRITGGGGGVTTFTNTNDAAKRVAYETVNSTQTGNVTIGDVDLSAAFWAGTNNVILSATAGTPVTADTIWFSDAGDNTIKKAAISTLPADSLQATCDIGNTTTTVINASAGSAAAPGYGINGDPNTGMFSAVSDTLGFSTGGTAALTIDATSNVGIGTTSPTAKLHVKENTGGVDVTTRFEPQSNNAKSILYLSSVSSGDGGYYYDSSSNSSGLFAYGDYTFNVGLSNIGGTIGDPRMIIKQGGNVGIGTTSPNVSLTINATDAVQFPAGTTTNRNAITTPANGMLRYSTTDNSFEGYINGAWGAIGGGVSITKEQKTGDGTTLTFSLTTAAGVTVDNLAIYIAGVYQNKLDASSAANFSVGAGLNPTLTFVTAPPVTSTNGIEIVITR